MHAYRTDRPEAGHDPAVRRRRAARARDRAAGREVPGRGRADRGEGRLHAPCSSASARAKAKNVTKPMRGHFAKAKVEPKAVAGRVPGRPRRRCSRSAREITVGHFVAGQIVDVSGVSDRQGLRRRHEAHNFAACAPPTACRSRTAATARPATGRIRAGCSRARRWPATWATARSPCRTSRWSASTPSAG